MSSYPKGHTGHEMVKTTNPRMVGGFHKNFKRQDGTTMYVFDIEFVSGFKSEYCYPGVEQIDFIEGKWTEFKVIDTNQHGTTIVPLQPAVTQQNLVLGASLSMAGHPAIFAMSMAKDIAPYLFADDGVTMTGLTETADTIYDWIMEKKNKVN